VHIVGLCCITKLDFLKCKLPLGMKVSYSWRNLTVKLYNGAGKSLARPTSRCILFDGENISFDASLVMYI
jgi:hypothetical protein